MGQCQMRTKAGLGFHTLKAPASPIPPADGDVVEFRSGPTSASRKTAVAVRLTGITMTALVNRDGMDGDGQQRQEPVEGAQRLTSRVQ